MNINDKKRNENIKNVYIVGMGIGSPGLLTYEAKETLDKCTAFAGAKRILEIIHQMDGRTFLCSYRVDEIMDFIDELPTGTNIAVLFSGDVGFYSGAKGLIGEIDRRNREENNAFYNTTIVPGLSSLTFFMDKLGKTWDDALLLSRHGIKVNLISQIRDNHKVAVLLGSGAEVSEICEKLVYYGLDEIEVTVGENLSYENERIVIGKPSQFLNTEFDSLSVALFENAQPHKIRLTAGIRDAEFIRDEGDGGCRIPMTKEEVRTLAISKLGMDKTSVIYDIGAGTGSVSVEMALIANEGSVYSVEMKETAIELLVRNKRKFIVDNMEIISGKAPDVLGSLPTPTHVFIGGSSGQMMEIISAVRMKNPAARFVVTAVTLETVAELGRITEEFPDYTDTFEIAMVNVSRCRNVGAYHMLSAENPVYIAVFGGKA